MPPPLAMQLLPSQVAKGLPVFVPSTRSPAPDGAASNLVHCCCLPGAYRDAAVDSAAQELASVCVPTHLCCCLALPCGAAQVLIFICEHLDLAQQGMAIL